MAAVYDPERVCARPRFFIVAPYFLRECGLLLPDIPTKAPCQLLGGPCHIVLDHLRERKTGLEHPILVIRCLAHGRLAFSVYPPGFTPHGRERMAPFAPDGSLLGSGDDRFRSTVLRSALDAASGRFWEPEALGYQDPRRWTQVRHIERALRWLGLEEARARGPNDPVVLFPLAAAYVRAKQSEDAVDALAAGLACFPPRLRPEVQVGRLLRLGICEQEEAGITQETVLAKYGVARAPPDTS